jgi:hypothetical protein
VLTFVAPAPFGGVLTSVPTKTPYPEVLLTWNAYANAIGYASVARQGCGTTCTCVTWSMAASATYVGASPALQMPDLSGLTGWDSRLQFVMGTAINGEIDAETSTAGSGDFEDPNPISGTVRTNAAFDDSAAP